MGVSVAFGCVILSLGVVASYAQGGCERYGSDATQAIRSAIIEGDLECTAALIGKFKDDPQAVAQGFVFDDPSVRNELFRKSEDRNKDADVITMKAFTKAALDTGDAEKLATIMVVSAVSKRVETLESALRESLGNRGLMSDVLVADANTAFLPDTGARRRILEWPDFTRRLTCVDCEQANSLVCNECWAFPVCKDFFWCKK